VTIIDGSALIAILRDEPEAMTCAKAIEAASHRRISAANFVESASPSTDRARSLPGFRSRHLARLSFVDCFSYALARATGEPLLFKCNDFAHTDITPALGEHLD
jgi:ribonuclease VapC